MLEDDHDSEYHYTGLPLEALQGLDTQGRVIYLGTFSKVLFPALRLGYLIVPPELIDSFTAARELVDRQSPSVEQAVLAAFIAEGHFARHVRRVRVLYAERQSALVEAAARELSGLLDVRSTEAGMHLVGWLPGSADDLAAPRRRGRRGSHRALPPRDRTTATRRSPSRLRCCGRRGDPGRREPAAGGPRMAISPQAKYECGNRSAKALPSATAVFRFTARAASLGKG